MNKLQPPNVPCEEKAERMNNAVKRIFAVPTEAVTKEKKRMKRTAARRKKARERTLSR